MEYLLVNISSYSIIPAALLGLLRWQKIGEIFRPFIILIWVGLLNEFITDFCIAHFRSNAVNSNIYVLAEAFFILWQFKRWKLFSHDMIYKIIATVLAAVWLSECFVFSRITAFCSYYRIIYAFLIVLISILMVNRLIVSEQQAILKNPAFLICCGFIFYYTYQVLVEIFYLYGLSSSEEFSNSVYHILSCINIFTNLLFAVAILWMPRKREFIQLS